MIAPCVVESPRERDCMQPFEEAANLVMDEMEKLFGVVCPNGRVKTIRAMVNILDHFAIPKTLEEIRTCDCAACRECRQSPATAPTSSTARDAGKSVSQTKE